MLPQRMSQADSQLMHGAGATIRACAKAEASACEYDLHSVHSSNDSLHNGLFEVERVRDACDTFLHKLAHPRWIAYESDEHSHPGINRTPVLRLCLFAFRPLLILELLFMICSHFDVKLYKCICEACLKEKLKNYYVLLHDSHLIAASCLIYEQTGLHTGLSKVLNDDLLLLDAKGHPYLHAKNVMLGYIQAVSSHFI
ncbi:hypothetical protein HELRODRAFT_163758 [Helobdella robusta]|uniref:Uncharacterized protein n=1 Tax=Helobdella robusta TaxID=6412 RepID=T1EUF5_HELRO|nr:hypothetical protein HELRODRAFT_163758 [Helobdella robusta]ESN96664.1 hypothetical protein HELRODRAFT_163758 [Helobdella robusta]